MTADNDTQTTADVGVPPTNEASPSPEQEDASKRRGSVMWAVLAAILLLAIVILLFLTQCTPRVPDVTGMTRKLAEQTLVEAGYRVGDVSLIAESKKKVGEVVGQAPEGGSIFAKGNPVDLIVIKGSDLVKVPDVVGNDTPAAKIALDAKGLGMEPTGAYSDTVPVGAIVSQVPLPGTLVRVDSAVAVTVSLGPVPEVPGGSVPTNSSTSAGSSSGGSTSSSQYANAPGCDKAYPGASVWSSGGDIYARLTSGGATKRLTSGSAWDTDPMLAPSKKYVVFMRAPSKGSKPNKIGRVCFSTFDVATLSLPEPPFEDTKSYWYSDYIFAPGPNGTAPDSDWLIVGQLYHPDTVSSSEPSGRLLVCSVPINSTWVSWNNNLRPTSTLTFARGTQAGSVKVRSMQIKNGVFFPYTGLYRDTP